MNQCTPAKPEIGTRYSFAQAHIPTWPTCSELRASHKARGLDGPDSFPYSSQVVHQTGV